MKTATNKALLTTAMLLGTCGLSACTGTSGTSTSNNAGFVQRGSYQTAANAPGRANNQNFSNQNFNSAEGSPEQALGGEYAQNESFEQRSESFSPAGRGSSRVFVSIPGSGREPEGFAAGADNWAQATFTTEGSDFDPCISRDGKTLIFASTQHRPTSDIYAKSVDGRVVTQLTNDGSDDVMPSISPDGQRIAFSSNRNGNWNIFVMPITGGQAVQITSDSAHELHPSWSPDGSKLVFCRLGTTSGRWELWVTQVQNNAVSHFIGYGMFPSWSPVASTGAEGGDRILFQRGRERGARTFGIWTLDYTEGQASNFTEVASSSDSALINPTWTLDGQRVIYTQIARASEWDDRRQAKPSAADLWMSNLDGTGRVRLTSGPAVTMMPSAGPNDRVFFVSDRSGVETVWSIDLGNAILAAQGPSAKGAPAVAQNPPAAHDSQESNAGEHGTTEKRANAEMSEGSDHR
jgi:TolB protein